MPPSPPPPLPLGAAAGSSAAAGSPAGTPGGSLAELWEAQEETADALQLVAEEVERQGSEQAQVSQRLVAIELAFEALPAALEERFVRLEDRQAATDQRLAGVERQQVASGRAVACSGRQQPSTSSAPEMWQPAMPRPRSVTLPQPQQTAGVAAAAPAALAAAGQAAVALVLPHMSPAGSAAPLQEPRLRIGDHSFASEDAAWALIRQLKRDLLNKPVRWDDQERGASFRFLLGLLGRHPRGAAKVLHPPVTQREEPPAVKLADAMASAVQQDKARFRRSCPQQRCQLCGACPTVQLVVEHDRPTMPQLRSRFLDACRRSGLPVPSEFAAHPETNATVFRAEDGDFAELWRQYHAQHARLRLLCKTCLWAENERRGIMRCKGHLLLLDRRQQERQQEWRHVSQQYLGR